MATVPLYSDWAPGPQSQPLVKKSKYLADALKSLQEQSLAPKSGGELASRLLADALLTYGDKKNDRKLADAQKADVSSESAATMASLGIPASGATPAPPVAPPVAAASSPAPALAQALAAPSAAPIQSSPLPDISANRSNGTSPLGIRGNNPTNIRDTSIPWQGANGAAGGFETFDTLENGIRAGARNLQNKQKMHGLDTIEGIIGDPKAGWAPASDNNDVPSYVQALAKATGYDPQAHLNLSDPAVNQSLLSAIIGHENGQNPYSPDQIKGGVMSALSGGAPPAPAPPPAMPPPQQNAPQPPMPQQAAPAPQQAQGPAQPPLGGLGATAQEKAIIQQLYARGDPRSVEAARELGNKIIARESAPPQYEISTTRGGQVVMTDKATGQMHVQDIPGFRAPLQGNFAYDQSGAAKPIPGTQTTLMSGQQLGIQAPNGTMFNHSPSGENTIAFQPSTGYESAGAGALRPQAGGPASPTNPTNIVANEGKLRDDYDRDMKDFNTARQAFSRLQTAASDNTGTSDIALVYNFMRTLDPTSTVREGEFATAQNSGSLPQSVMNAYNKALKGERLQPEQRQQFVQTGAHQFQSYQDRANQLNQRYSGIAQSYGFDPSRIVQPITSPELPHAQSGQPGGGTGAGVGGRAPDPLYQAAIAEKQRREALRRSGR